MEKKSDLEFSFDEIESSLQSKPFYTLFFNLVILSLFFIQALRVFLPGVYVALSHVVFYENIAENLPILLTLVFFVLPALTNTICKKFGIKRVLVASIYVIAICRLLIALHLPNIFQTIFSGITVSVYGMFISTFLTVWIKDEKIDINSSNKIIFVIFSIMCAFLLDYLIRTIGFSQDISLLPPGLSAEFWYVTQYVWLFIQIPLTIICIYFTRLYFPRFTISPDVDDKNDQDKKSTRYSLIFVGVGAFWFLLFNIFLYPNIIAHYTSTNYYVNNILSIVALIAFILIIFRVKRQTLSNIKTVAILNGVMIVSLCLFLFLGRILTYIAAILVFVSMIIMYLNFYLLFVQMSTINFKWEKVKTISNAFAIGLVFYILFTVLHIFTINWAFIISAFKGLGPIIVLLASVLLVASTIISIHLNPRRE